jgi:hypothetical protein
MCVWETYIFEDICQCETANCSIDERVTDFSYLWKNALHIISKRTGSMMAGNKRRKKKKEKFLGAHIKPPTSGSHSFGCGVYRCRQ